MPLNLPFLPVSPLKTQSFRSFISICWSHRADLVPLCLAAFECHCHGNAQCRLQAGEGVLLPDARATAPVLFRASARRSTAPAARLPDVARPPLLLPLLVPLVLRSAH